MKPLGIPTVIASNDPGLLTAVCDLYGEWRADPADTSRLTLHVDVAGDLDMNGSSPADIGVDGPRLTLHDEGVVGWADARSGEARVRLSPARAANRAALANAADTLLLFLLTRSGRIPLHAAGVMVGETALILAGPSGAGKSTLALRAMQRGLPILSDDTVYIQLQPGLRVWGFRRPLHVFPAEAPRFTLGVRLRAGREKAAVPLSPMSADWPLYGDKTALVILSRGQQVALDPIDIGTATAALSQLEEGFDLLAEASALATAALAEKGAWRLALTHDPDAALDRLIEAFSDL
jgi:hypothetical protein